MPGVSGWRQMRWRRMGVDDATLLAGSGLTVVNGQLTASIATWDATLVRYYFLDYDGGSDTNTGYIDAAAGTTFSAGQLTGVPLKTIERLLQILPRCGAGRSFVLLLKPRAAGATYRNIADSADDSLNLNGVIGYGYVGVRGSNDLTNSASDRITLGQIQSQVGPGGSGEWTVVAGATTTTVPVAAGLNAEPALIGMRIRFDANTTTAALRNTSTMVIANTGTVVTTGTALAAVPAVGDIFYIERPGVRMASFIAPDSGISGRGGASAPVAVAGIAVTGTATASMSLRSAGLLQASFIEATGSTTNLVVVDGAVANFLTIQSQYPDETGAFITGGIGLRANGGVNLVLGTGTRFVLRSTFLHATAVASLGGLSGQWTGYAQAGLSVVTSGDSGAVFTVGSSTAGQPRSRILSGTLRIAGRATVRAVDITNSGANACISLGSSGADNITRTGVFSIDDVVGSTGNTGVGIDASNLVGSNVYLGRTVANTVTGTGGDIKLAGGAIADHPTFTLTGFEDNAHNTLLGSAGAVSGEAILVTNQSGGALAVGNVVKSNGTTAQVTNAKADTSAASAAVLGVMVTPPASTAVGYMVTAGPAYVLYDGAPTVGAIAYGSPGTAGKATTTVPAVAGTNQKIRVGRVITASGSTGYTAWGPDWLAVAADGNP